MWKVSQTKPHEMSEVWDFREGKSDWIKLAKNNNPKEDMGWWKGV